MSSAPVPSRQPIPPRLRVFGTEAVPARYERFPDQGGELFARVRVNGEEKVVKATLLPAEEAQQSSAECGYFFREVFATIEILDN